MNSLHKTALVIIAPALLGSLIIDIFGECLFGGALIVIGVLLFVFAPFIEESFKG